MQPWGSASAMQLEEIVCAFVCGTGTRNQVFVMSEGFFGA
jgi:hypothetical protein